MDNIITEGIISLIIIILLFLIFREVANWYWKINERIFLMREQNELLRKLVSGNAPIKEAETKIEKDAPQNIKDFYKKNIQEAKIPKESNSKPIKNSGKKGKFNFYWLYFIALVIIIGIYFFNPSPKPQKIDWKELKPMLINKDVQKMILFNKRRVKIYIKSAPSRPRFYLDVASPDVFIQKVTNAQQGFANPVYVESVSSQKYANVVIWLLPILIILIVILLIFFDIHIHNKTKK